MRCLACVSLSTQIPLDPLLVTEKVLREKLPIVERLNCDYKVQVQRLTEHLADLEAEYGETDSDLKLMLEKFGNLNAHMEHVLLREAKNSEDSLEDMQRRVSLYILAQRDFSPLLRHLLLFSVRCMGSR